MKFKNKFVALLTSVFLLLGILSQGSFAAADDWSGWNLSGGAKSTGEVLTVTSGDGTVQSAAKSANVPSSYVVRANIKVTSFSGETGMQITNGKHRLIVYIDATALRIGSTPISYPIGNSAHDYEFSVSGDKVDVYIDDEYVGTRDLQVNTMTGRLYFWTKNSGTAKASLSVEDFEFVIPTATATKPTKVEYVRGEPTKYYYQDWEKVGDWQLSEPDVKVIDAGDNGKDVKLDSVNSGVVSSCMLYYSPTDDFVWKFRLKVDSFNGETGAKMEYGPYRTFMYFGEKSINLRARDKDVSVKTDVGHDWHEYALEVHDGEATFFMDGEKMAEYSMPEYTLEKPVMSFWVKPSGGNPVMQVDWAEYTPFVYNLNVYPLNESEFVQGDDIKFTAEYVGFNEAPDYVEYKANGTYIGQGEAPDYEFVWEDAPFGNYQIEAYNGEDVSKPSKMHIVRAFGGELNLPSQIGYGSKLSASFVGNHTTYDAKIESVRYVGNGINVTSSDKRNNFKADLGRLCVGSYSVKVYAKDSFGAEILADEKTVNVVSSKSKAMLGQEYEISYRTQGNGSIFAEDGFYKLDIRHTADNTTVATADGDEILRLGQGDYILTVQSGVLSISRNGAFEKSVVLPRVDKKSPVEANGIKQLSIVPLALRPILFEGKGNIAESFVSLPKDWSLEFEKTGMTPETIEVSDGSYSAVLSIGDSITAETAPLGETYAAETETIHIVQEGRHHYRITSQRGIAQLFVDGKFAASIRLPQVGGFAKLIRKGADKNAMTILREESELYTFEDDFEGTKSVSSEEYWMGEQTISIMPDGQSKVLYIPANEKWMNVFTENFTFSGKMKIGAGYDGGAWIVFRRNSEAEYMAVGYNYDTNKWELHKNHASDNPAKTVLASVEGEAPGKEWFDVNLDVSKNIVEFSVNGEKILTETIDYMSHGNVGVQVDRRGGIYLDNIKLQGDGMVRAGVIEQTFGYDTVEFIEIDSDIYMTKGSKPEKSTNRGRSFSTVEDGTGSRFTSNTIQLHDGSIVSIGLVPGAVANTYWDEAWISKDKGVTFSGPYRIETREGNRITMNNKLIQTTNGRIIFCVGESGHGNEAEGKMAVYYSDDGGYNWSESKTELSYDSTGINVLEGKVIEMPDKTLKCFMRTDRGYIYTSESKDNGETWSLELEKTQLPISSCAMNIERDPSDPFTYYMVYEYENTNEDPSINYPRWRTSLAVSYDGCETWEYVTDLSAADVRVEGEKKCLDHMNQGLRVFDDCIMVDVSLRMYNNGKATKNIGKVWRVDKEMIRSQKRIPLTYNYGKADGFAGKMDYSILDCLFIQSKVSDAAVIFGEELKVHSKAENSLINAEDVAKYLNADVSYENSKIVLNDGKTEAEFTIGSTQVLINGENYIAAEKCLGVEKVPVDAVAKAYNKTFYVGENFIGLSVDDIWDEDVLTMLGEYIQNINIK